MKAYQYSMQHPSITSIFNILKFPIQLQYLQLNISKIFEKGSKICWRSCQLLVNLMKSHIMIVKSHDQPMTNHMNYKDLFVRISQITKICSWESHELHRCFVNIFWKRNIWNRSWYENTKSTFQIIKSF